MQFLSLHTVLKRVARPSPNKIDMNILPIGEFKSDLIFIIPPTLYYSVRIYPLTKYPLFTALLNREYFFDNVTSFFILVLVIL